MQLASIYLEKQKIICYQKLPDAQKKVAEIQSLFNKSQIKQLEQLEKKKEDQGFTDVELKNYFALHKLKSKLLIAETRVDFYTWKAEKYQRRFKAMSNMDNILQQTFYLEMLASKICTFTSYLGTFLVQVSRYKGSALEDHILAQREQINLQWPELQTRTYGGTAEVVHLSEKFNQEDVKGIDFKEWCNTGKYVTAILSASLQKKAYKRHERLKLYNRYEKVKRSLKIGNSVDTSTSKYDQLLSLEKEKIRLKLEDIQRKL